MRPHLPRLLRLAALVAGLAALGGGLVAVVMEYGRDQEELLRAQARRELESVAVLQARLVHSWRDEREGNAELLQHDAQLPAALAGGALPSSMVDSLLRSLCTHGYTYALLLDEGGNVRARCGAAAESDGASRKLVESAISTGRVQWSDLRSRRRDGVLELAVPLSASPGPNVLRGALVLGADVKETLFSVLQSWPVPRDTAEAHLVQRDGDDVVFLSGSGGRSQAGPEAVGPPHPVTEARHACVQVVLGAQAGSGLDHRGAGVLFAGRPVNGTPWFVVTKVDEEEVVAPARARAGRAAGVAFVFVVVAGLSALLWLRAREARSDRGRRKAEEERDEIRRRFEGLAELANDIVLLVREDGHIVEANRRATEAYGWSREELQSMVIRELRDPATLVERPAVLPTDDERRRTGLRFETRHRRRDGSIFPVEVSASHLVVQGSHYWQCLLRDITERQRAEERFRLAFEGSPDPMTLARLEDGILVAVNDGFLRLFGLSEERVLGRTTVELGIWLEPEIRRALVERVRSGEIVRGIDIQVPAADGGVRVQSLSARKVLLAGVPHMLALSRDVTEERAAAAELRRLTDELRRSEARYRNVVRNVPVVQWAIDQDGTATLAEGSGLASLGVALRGLAGRSVFDVFREHPRIVEDCRSALKGERFVSTYTFGDVIFEGHWAPIHDAAGQVVGATGIALDVTARVRAEEAVTKSEERLRRILETMTEGVCELDHEGRIVFANTRLGEILALPPHDMIGRALEDLVPSEGFTSDLAVHGDRDRWELKHRRKDGVEIELLASMPPLLGPEGQVSGRVAVYTDITELRRAEKQFLHAQKMEAVGRLASGVAHDFNNLLAVILAGCDFILASPGASAEVLAEARDLREAGKRAAKLVRQLLTFSRRSAHEPVLTDLNAIVGGIEKLLRKTVGERITVEVELTADPWPVKLDPSQVDQILMNLAVNSHDAMAKGGSLRVETRNIRHVSGGGFEGLPSGRWASLIVSDTGCGMTPEVSARIFEPFFTTKGIGKGTGLGLSTVLGIVQQADGHITVESEPGQGTTFRIFFPAAERVEHPEHALPESLAVLGQGRTVLVVDDDGAVRLRTVRMLRNCGFETSEAASGHEAMDIAAKHDPHVVLTDVVMPGMAGPELAERLRSLRPNLPIVFLSGHVDRPDSRLPKDALLLTKPCSPRALASMLARALTTANSA